MYQVIHHEGIALDGEIGAASVRWPVMAMFVLHMKFKNEPQRIEARPAHREHLKRLHEAGRLISAGPLADDTGALHIYDVADDAELQRILESDPYTAADAYEIVMLKEWTRLL